MPKFSHVDDEGRVRMVDVTAKKPTVRTAVAGGTIHMNPETLDLIQSHKVKKGNSGQNPKWPPAVIEYIRQKSSENKKVQNQ